MAEGCGAHRSPQDRTQLSVDSYNEDIREAQATGEVTIQMLREHQQAWEVFGSKVVHLIPVLKAHMSGVTQETERAALELMMSLRVLMSLNIEGVSKDASASLSKAVTAMQFQDITRQKLEHVCVALDQFDKHVHALLKGPGHEGAKQEIAALENLEEKYTMEAERRIHQSALRTDCPDYGEPVPTGLSDEGSDSVELF